MLTNTHEAILSAVLGRTPPKQQQSPPEHEFCSECREHADFERDNKDEEWWSVCCGVKAWSYDV